MRKMLSLFVVFCFLLISDLFASYDLPVNKTAKINGLAGAGIAHLDGAGSVVLNPAGIYTDKKFQFSFTGNNAIMSTTAPANGADTSVNSKAFVPLMVMSATYKPTDYMVTGFYFYTPAGAGGKYKNIDYGIPGLTAKDLEGSALLMELGPAVAFKLPYDIKIGLTYRINYVKLKSNSYDPTTFGTGNVAYNYMKLSGFGFKGLNLGIQYHPIEPLYFGLTYRSFTKIETEGTLTQLINNTTTLDPIAINSEVKYADKFGLGVTYDFAESNLLVALDYSLYFYSAYTSNTIVMTESGISMTLPVLNKNMHVINLGAEYDITPNIPLRIGFGYLSKIANEATHGATSTTSPAPTYVFAVGSSYRISETIMLDFAYNLHYNVGSITTDEATTPYATTGNYKSINNHLSATINYEF